MIEFRGRRIPETLAEIVAPAHTALVVHELLNDFCAEGGFFDAMGYDVSQMRAVIDPIAVVLEAARAV